MGPRVSLGRLPCRPKTTRHVSRSAWVFGALGLVATVVLVTSSGLVSDDVAVIIDDSAQLGAGVAAAVACLVTARRAEGPERTWRRLMGFGMAGWSVGMALWAWYQIVADTPLPSPSWADVGFLTMPVLALPALLSLAVAPPRQGDRPDPQRSIVFFIDGVVVVGSLFLLTWATSLGAVVHSVAPTTGSFLVAVAYPATDLVLVVMVVLLTVTRRVPPRLHTQLWLLGWGLVAISVSDSIFAYLVSTGAGEMPPATNAGFVAGPLLIALAALAPARPPGDDVRDARRSVERAHLLLPYALVALTATVIAVESVAGADIDAVEAVLAWVVVVVGLARQMLTLIQNNALLERVSATQAELAHQAHHDPLTGLANRALFGDRLDAALARHHGDGQAFALLVIDLDDFKEVNDSYGHSVGDRVLRAVGERLCGCVRSGDTVARLGGDEFAVVLDGDGHAPEAVRQRIVAAMRQPFEIDGTLLALGASVGVGTPLPTDGDLTADLLLHRADSAMYVAKRRTKGEAAAGGTPGMAVTGR